MRFAIFVCLLLLVIPLHAGTLTFQTVGTLGPLLSGLDPLGFSGDSFTLSGTLASDAVPVSTTADSATYDFADDLQIMLGAFPLTGYFATITFTDAPTGPDLVSVDFNAVEFSFTPIINATLSLPEGTLNGTGIQNFSAPVSQPDSNFSFTLPGTSQVILGTLGITGTASLAGGSPSSVPEPGTLALLAAGLLAIGGRAFARARR
jgi:PEP-CTERM motif